jgi:hypothetical protein
VMTLPPERLYAKVIMTESEVTMMA